MKKTLITLAFILMSQSCGEVAKKGSNNGSTANNIVVVDNNKATNNQSTNNQTANNQTTMTTPTVIPEGCGDMMLGTDEECEGFELRGNQCVSLGFEGGVLSCTQACKFDLSDCYKCGDGVIQNEERCDGSDFGGETCQTVVDASSSGELGCSDRCRIDTENCVLPVYCDESAFCFFDCGSDEECQEQCPPVRAGEKADYDALFACAEANNCSSFECIDTRCTSEVNACLEV